MLCLLTQPPAAAMLSFMQLPQLHDGTGHVLAHLISRQLVPSSRCLWDLTASWQQVIRFQSIKLDGAAQLGVGRRLLSRGDLNRKP